VEKDNLFYRPKRLTGADLGPRGEGKGVQLPFLQEKAEEAQGRRAQTERGGISSQRDHTAKTQKKPSRAAEFRRGGEV